MGDIPKEELKRLQRDHMTFLEGQLGGNQFVVSGVPVLKCFNYKLIQVVNNLGLRAMLEAGENGQSPDKP